MAAGHKRNSETSSKRNWTNSTTQKGGLPDSHKAPDCPEVLKADYKPGHLARKLFLQFKQKCIQYRQMDRQLQVISREGKSFSISLQAAKMSLTLRNMFDYIVNDELNDEIEAIPLGLIDSNTLDKIVQFCEHYKTETNPEEERSYEINEWDSNFFDINISTMFDIAKAADYLQIHRLFDISCKIVAKFLRSKSPQDIRQALGMGNDFEEYQNDKVFNAL
ncbi:S-phase kinase-associated protein [Trichinella pseudospiralis]